MSSQTSRKVSGERPEQEHMTGLAGRLAFAWAFVGIPLAYGVFETAKKAAALFTG